MAHKLCRANPTHNSLKRNVAKRKITETNKQMSENERDLRALAAEFEFMKKQGLVLELEGSEESVKVQEEHIRTIQAATEVELEQLDKCKEANSSFEHESGDKWIEDPTWGPINLTFFTPGKLEDPKIKTKDEAQAKTRFKYEEDEEPENKDEDENDDEEEKNQIMQTLKSLQFSNFHHFHTTRNNCF